MSFVGTLFSAVQNSIFVLDMVRTHKIHAPAPICVLIVCSVFIVGTVPEKVIVLPYIFVLSLVLLYNMAIESVDNWAQVMVPLPAIALIRYVVFVLIVVPETVKACI